MTCKENNTLLSILEKARWSPSGENEQPWMFEIKGEFAVDVHVTDSRTKLLYDLDGNMSAISHGALIETLRIVASDYGLSMSWDERANLDGSYVIEVKFHDTNEERNPLVDHVMSRTVQRRALRTTPLTVEEKRILSESLEDFLEIQFRESWAEKWECTKMKWFNTRCRLSNPDAYEVHKGAIEWGTDFSKTKVPASSVGVDPLTVRIMKWVMDKKSRVLFFNKWMSGAEKMSLQMDIIPGMLCAAHVLIRTKENMGVSSREKWVRFGENLQRFWLTAESMGIRLQPEMTPIVFSHYALLKKSPTTAEWLKQRFKASNQRYAALIKPWKAENMVFMCRLGKGDPARARSTRKDLKDMLL